MFNKASLLTLEVCLYNEKQTMLLQIHRDLKYLRYAYKDFIRTVAGLEWTVKQ